MSQHFKERNLPRIGAIPSAWKMKQLRRIIRHTSPNTSICRIGANPCERWAPCFISAIDPSMPIVDCFDEDAPRRASSLRNLKRVFNFSAPRKRGVSNDRSTRGTERVLKSKVISFCLDGFVPKFRDRQSIKKRLELKAALALKKSFPHSQLC